MWKMHFQCRWTEGVFFQRKTSSDNASASRSTLLLVFSGAAISSSSVAQSQPSELNIPHSSSSPKPASLLAPQELIPWWGHGLGESRCDLRGEQLPQLCLWVS